MVYTVQKEKGSSRYYVCKVEDNKPIMHGDKKRIYRLAAKMNNIELKTFIKMKKAGEPK